MTHRLNDFGQPIGLPVDGFVPCAQPDHRVLAGQYAVLVPMAQAHAKPFFDIFDDPSGWTYLGADEPFRDLADAENWVAARVPSRDPLFYTILVDDRPVGFFTLLRINPEAGSIETGYIHFSPALQGTKAATEAHYLLMRHVFEDLGYRRYEWKCDALNAPSQKAARRLGFTYEGTFRQALVYKGRNRDTAWFSILDGEWPAVKARFETWLDPANFDDQGVQKTRLAQR